MNQPDLAVALATALSALGLDPDDPDDLEDVAAVRQAGRRAALRAQLRAVGHPSITKVTAPAPGDQPPALVVWSAPTEPRRRLPDPDNPDGREPDQEGPPRGVTPSSRLSGRRGVGR